MNRWLKLRFLLNPPLNPPSNPPSNPRLKVRYEPSSHASMRDPRREPGHVPLQFPFALLSPGRYFSISSDKRTGFQRGHLKRPVSYTIEVGVRGTHRPTPG